MHADRSQLAQSAFGPDSRDVVTVKYQSFKDSVAFLRAVLQEPDLVGSLHGPELSGKTTIVRYLAATLGGDAAVAVVDATRKRPLEFLTEIILQFGYDTDLHSADELLKMISVFAIQQARAHRPPVLVVDNIDKTLPGTRQTLKTLADLTGQGRSALRMLFTSCSEREAGIPGGQVRTHAVGPMSRRESTQYLYTRLQTVGVQRPDTLIPPEVGERLHEESGGWPGELNRRARHELSPALPRLVVSHDGEIVQDYTFKQRQVLIGRSGFADIVLSDKFASKLHAVLLLYSDALVLIDLNSANGTTVNSRPVKSTILKDSDVITLGHHRIKVSDPPLVTPEMEEILRRHDTLKMRNLVEARRLREARQPSTRRRR